MFIVIDIYIHHIIYVFLWYLQSEHLEACNLYMPQEIDRAIKRCHLKGFVLNYRNFIIYYIFLLDNVSLPQEWKCCIHCKHMWQLWYFQKPNQHENSIFKTIFNVMFLFYIKKTHLKFYCVQYTYISKYIILKSNICKQNIYCFMLQYQKNKKYMFYL
jgi:hypothetical protein